MSTRITPTIGRRVWFWPSTDGKPRDDFSLRQPIDPVQAFDAGVVFVHPDGRVNLSVTDHYGNVQRCEGVPLIQEDDQKPEEGYFATWMPYQQGQAQRHAARESGER